MRNDAVPENVVSLKREHRRERGPRSDGGMPIVRVRTPETGSGQPEVDSAAPPARRERGGGLFIAATALVVSALFYVLYLSRRHMLSWFDLDVYNHAGLIVRQHPAILYSWHLLHTPGIKFTYTPFAGLIFAAGSELSLPTLHWLMTVTSIAALMTVIWLTFRALDWHGQRRLTATLGVSALCLWLEPVIRALILGQIELLLMVLIIWDLSQSDRRWWKGAGIGIAAGVKMVPLIFIPYLVLCGKFRQAAVAAGTFAVTIVLGFLVLPHASTKWWLTGYFLHAGNTGDVSSLVNQSLYALIARAMGGSTQAAPVWLVVDVLVALAGLTAGAVLHRRGQPVAGWITCAITGLLVSPISWDQHWVWVVPALVLMIDRAVRSSGLVRAAYWALAIAVAVVYGGWPNQWSGRYAFDMYYGLISFFNGPHPQDEIYHLHGLQLISWNLFVVAGLAMLAFAIAAAVHTWRAGKAVDTAKPTSLPTS
jgi:alpha-1,2-mannosyltransferase